MGPGEKQTTRSWPCFHSYGTERGLAMAQTAMELFFIMEGTDKYMLPL